MRMFKPASISFLAIMFSLALASAVSAQSGGTFQITQSVIAGGGGSSSGGTFGLVGAAGQAAAGTTSSGGTYSVSGGFFQPGQSAPTAASVPVTGRVMTSAGNGLRNALVTLTSASGVTMRALTSSMGYFRFEEVPAGDTYTVAIESKRFTFAPRLISVTDAVDGLEFIAQ